MLQWNDVIEINGRHMSIKVMAEWEDEESYPGYHEQLHPGYWNITVAESCTDEDVTGKVGRQTMRRLEAKAQKLANPSWDNTAINFVLDIWAGD